MKLDETKLQEIVEKIAYQQFGEEQIDDLYAKMGMLNEYMQEQLRLYNAVGQSEQLLEFKEWERDKCRLPWDAEPKDIVEQYLSR